MPPPAFDRLGPAVPSSPVVLSVPHAGRDYPAALLDALAVPRAALAPLEDRYVDVVALAAHRAEVMLVQNRARAWIDLNRGEDERDPAVDEGAAPGAPASAKVRAGLGLVPRRAGSGPGANCGGGGGLWRRRWRAEEIAARIAADHRPYHEALAVALAAARARFGTAILLDVHSMPPLPGNAAGVVIGDRRGTSAAGRFTRRLHATAAAAGLSPARNAPYAGGHVVARHGRPSAGIHALQLEIDRSRYLDRRLDEPVPAGVDRMAAFLRDAIDALAEEAGRLPDRGEPHPIAAE